MRNLLIITIFLFSSNSFGSEVLLPDFTDNPGVVSFHAADYDSAKKYFNAHLGKEDALRELSLLYLAKLAMFENDGKLSTAYIEEALIIAPNNEEELILAAEIYCARARQVSVFSALKLGKKCGEYYDKAATQNPQNSKALKLAAQFHFYAPSIAGGDDKSARTYLKQLQSLSEEDARVLQLLILEKDEGEKEALLLAEKYAALEFERSENWYELALFYRDRKNPLKAEEILNANLEKSKVDVNDWHSTDALFQLGELFIKNGEKIGRGIELIEKYLHINQDMYDPHYFWSRWRLAIAYKTLGNEDKYLELVNEIKSKNYALNKHFSKEFEKSI